MRQSLLILTGVLLVTAGAHAQPAPEPQTPPTEATAPNPEVPAVEPAAVPAALPATDAAPPPDTAAPPPAASAGADASGGEMSAAELAELGLNTTGPAVDTSIHLSGFADFTVVGGLNAAARATGDEYRSFAVGNLNLYLSKNLNENFRTMIEVRFMYLPNGAGSAYGAAPASTLVTDYADFNRVIKWGGVDIQRAYLEWSPLTFLTLRVGQYLTPYGVWNVDHGTPTIIPAAKPYVIGAGFFPAQQTGFELYGRTDVSDNSAIGYHLTLSNGTGSAAEYKDLDKNKAVGARAYWETHALGEFRFGGSAYYGTDTQGTSTLGIVNGALASIRTISSQSDTLAFGLDAVWRLQGIYLQAEWLCLQRKYTDAGRVSTVSLTGETKFFPDTFSWGTYVLLGYRFDWYGIMPFVMYQNLDQPDTVQFRGLHAGVNIRPIDPLAIKLQYDNVKSGDTIFHTAYVQAAWAF